MRPPLTFAFRELALANRELARAGGDPLAARRRAEGMPSFEEASEKVVAIHSGGWKDGGKSAKQWRASLSEYAYQRIGDKGVDQVTTADVMAADWNKPDVSILSEEFLAEVSCASS